MPWNRWMVAVAGIAGAVPLRVPALALALAGIVGTVPAQAEQSVRSWQGVIEAGDSGAALHLAQSGAGCALPSDAGQRVSGMLEGINAERARRGLGRLRHDDRLTRAAQIIACDNAAHGQMSHSDSQGRSVMQRVQALGYRYRIISENISMRRSGAESAVEAWVGSPSHNRNMFEPRIRDFGAAVALAANGQIFWAAVHGADR